MGYRPDYIFAFEAYAMGNPQAIMKAVGEHLVMNEGMVLNIKPALFPVTHPLTDYEVHGVCGVWITINFTVKFASAHEDFAARSITPVARAIAALTSSAHDPMTFVYSYRVHDSLDDTPLVGVPGWSTMSIEGLDQFSMDLDRSGHNKLPPELITDEQRYTIKKAWIDRNTAKWIAQHNRYVELRRQEWRTEHSIQES